MSAALARLQQAPTSIDAQRAYLAAFPKTYPRFVSILGFSETKGPGALEEHYDKFLDPILEIGDHLPRETFAAVFRIERNGKWCADAVGQLQYETIQLANRHPVAFGRELARLTRTRRQGVMRFLLDGPVPANMAKLAEPISQKLRRVGYRELSDEFEPLIKRPVLEPGC